MEKETASKKTIFIAGAGGLLGRKVAERFGASGWRVLAFKHSELDISREEEVLALVSQAAPAVDLVVNCAATTDVDRCEREPDWAYAVNERGPRYLARACRALDAEFVHISTDYVFDGTKGGLYTQKDDPNPLSVYAASKLAGEQAAAEEMDRVYLIRSSWIFGKGGKNFGSRVIEYARAGASLKGVSDQTSIPTYAPDLAGRIEEIVCRGIPGLYQVTNTGPATWLEFARMVLDLAGLAQIEIAPVTRAELGQAARRPCNSAMRCLLSEALGLAPLRHWRESLEGFVAESVDSTG